MAKLFNIDKELEFINGVKFLKEKYGKKEFLKYYWKPQYYKNGFPIIKHPKKLQENDIEYDLNQISYYLENPREHSDNEKQNYKKMINYIIKTYKFKLKNPTLLQRASIYRYYVINALDNISLSVSPKIKKQWKINFELFGSFYNTNYDFCGLFSDIEESCCDFYTFKVKPNMVILINPPYTERWIKISCITINNIMNQNLHTKIFLVIPIWNINDRKLLNLELFDDLKEIDEMKESKYLVKHDMVNIDFYNGVTQKNVKLKDKVHVFVFKNY